VGEPAVAAMDSDTAATELSDKGDEDGARNVAKARLHDLVESSRATIDQLQASFDERISELVPGLGLIRELRAQIKDLSERVERLEAMATDRAGQGDGEEPGGAAERARGDET